MERIITKIKNLIKRKPHSSFIRIRDKKIINFVENLFNKVLKKNKIRLKQNLEICLYSFTVFSLSGLYLGVYAADYHHKILATVFFIHCYFLPNFFMDAFQEKIHEPYLGKAISLCKKRNIENTQACLKQFLNTLPRPSNERLKNPSTSLKLLRVFFDNNKNTLEIKTRRKAGDLPDLS